MKIYIASSNKGKILEVKSFFPSIEFISQSEIENFVEPEEKGKTFEENSLIKARYLYSLINSKMENEDIIIADDAGIIIPKLGLDRLGVYTKREMAKWAKENNCLEIDYWNKVVEEAGIGSEVEFISAISVVNSNGEEFSFKKNLIGSLTYSRGENGFGFDPIFEYNGKTLAECNEKEKQEINPRVEALKNVAEKFLN